MFVAAAVAVGFASCSDDDDEGGNAAVGITNVSVTPAGSLVSYNCTVDQNTKVIENTSDSVAWDVTDAALANATVKATATLGATVYYNGQAVSADGVEVNTTAPITLEAHGDNGQVTVYTLNVVRAKTAANGGMTLKSSVFNGFPAGLVDFDIAYFKNKFYAITTAVTGDAESEEGQQEHYQLFTSEDGLNWAEVNYQTETNGVVLPEGQTAYVIGGEGARLQVFNDRLYVLGGARTKGADKYGNAAETGWGWTGPAPALDIWRSYSTADGITFRTDTIGATYKAGDVEMPVSRLAVARTSTVAFNGKMYMKTGYMVGFGMWQGKSMYVSTTDGKNWENVTPAATDGSNVDVNRRINDAFFAFKGKLWVVGGFTSFISANMMQSAIYSSTDGENWTNEGNLPESMTGLFGMKVVCNDNVAYMFGGQFQAEEGGTMCDKVFRSTDGVNWEEVETPANYTARRNVAGVAQGQQAWIFGGYPEVCVGSYGYPDATENVGTETWVKLMN